jgi:hypothetical protein
MWIGSGCRCYVGKGLRADDVMHKIGCRVLVISFLLMPRARIAAESVSIKTGTVCKSLMVAV